MDKMNAKEFFKSKYPEEGGYFACFHDEDMIEFAEAYSKHRIEELKTCLYRIFSQQSELVDMLVDWYLKSTNG